jgi:hypothetical protein
MKAADSVWVATALLQHERGADADFTAGEILDRAESEQLWNRDPDTLKQHVYKHNVAQLRAQPDTHRLLTRTGRGRRRLFRSGDPYDAAREGGKTHPEPTDVPEKYRSLVAWYITTFDSGCERATISPLLQLRELSLKLGIWKGIDPDQYVRESREDWEG